MRIGNFERFENGGSAAILAPFAMKCVEGNVWLEVLQDVDDLFSGDVDGDDLEAGPAQGVGAAFACREADGAFGRPAAHEDGDGCFSGNAFRHISVLPQEECRCA